MQQPTGQRIKADTDTTELWKATSDGDIKRVQAALDNGADINQPSGDSTALHVACAGNHVAIAKLLLEHKADVRSPIDPWYERNEEAGMRPLHIAARDGFEAIVEILLQAGADPSHRSWYPHVLTPLHLAASGGHAPVAKMLIAAKADINELSGPQYYESTPLHFAALGDHVHTMAMLSNEGADTSIQNSQGKRAADLLSAPAAFKSANKPFTNSRL